MSNSLICKTAAIVAIALLVFQVSAAATISISCTSSQLNVLANYTWTINFANATDRAGIVLKFPPETSFTISTRAYLNGNISTGITIASNTSNQLSLTGTGIFMNSIIILVVDVINPYSMIPDSGFSMTSSMDGVVSLDSSFLSFNGGAFTSCPWTFNSCTEKTNSELTIKVTLVNRLPQGNNKFLISYPSQWPNLSLKNLVTNASSFICSISLDGGTNFFPANVSNVTCSQGASQIIVSYTLANQLSTGQTFTVKVSGVNAPPTKETTTSDFFKVQTADGNSRIIDSLSRCTINPVCVTSASGTLQNTTQLMVNSLYNNPQINLLLTTPITFQVSDQVEAYYTPIGDLATSSSCSVGTLRFKRNSSPWAITRTNLTTFYTFVFSSDLSINFEYFSQMLFLFDCFTLKMPSSQTPVNLQLKFKRSSSYYLQLNTSIIALPSLLNNMTSSLVPSTYQMGKPATYVFAFTNGQPLGSNPFIIIQISSDIINSTAVTCSVSTNTISVTSSNCSLIMFVLTINLVASNTIPANSTFTITVYGLVNPLSPNLYNFKATTYYDSLVTSLVETNAFAFSASFTAITNPPIDLQPNSCAVYNLTAMTISFTNPLEIPSNSVFKIEFPSEISHIQVTSTPLNVGGSNMSVTGLTNVSSIIQFTTTSIISKGENIVISFSILTPTIMKSYSFVKLIITQVSTVYLQSLTTMSVNVNSVSSMPGTLVSNTPITGSPSSYSLTLNMTIPHSGNFSVMVDLPTDVSLASTGNTCNGSCSGALVSTSTSSFSFTAIYSGTASTLSFNMGTFVNPRSVGLASSWKITTLTLSPVNVISIQYFSATITTPNGLTGSLLLSESYYRNNSSPVKMSLSFVNQLIASDYLFIQIAKTTYTVPAALQCSAIYGACTLNSTNITHNIIKVVPNLTSVTNRTLSLVIEGLLSSPSTDYSANQTLSGTSFNASDCKLDTGLIRYNISCRDGSATGNNCKRCSSNGSCIDCYLSYSYYLQSGKCYLNTCLSATRYPNSTTGMCEPCTNNCATCTSSTACTTCINTTTYYFYPYNNSCQLLCANTSGFVVRTNATGSFCLACAGYPLCLQCTSNATGSCTRCNTSLATLSSGICTNAGCDVGFYPSGGRCQACNTNCKTCNGATNGNCIACKDGLFNFTGYCVDKCIDSALTPSTTNLCGCNSTCLKCLTTDYYACTVCSDPSKFVYQGTCTSSCPLKTYQYLTACLPCSTGCQNCTNITCTACNSSLLLYDGKCYLNCDAISPQYDSIPSGSCTLCPDGCDVCNGTICKTCLSAYTLSSTTSQCTKTCLLSNSCDITEEQVLPLPGLISVVLWAAIVVVIHLISHKNYIPYSLILLTGVIQFVLILAALSVANSALSSSARLLATASSEFRGIVVALLGLSVAANYITNIIYIIIFIRYLKPLLSNPRQIDVISNVVALIIGVATNYRFALIAFARMFPKPNIYIEDPKHFSQVHTLCIVSIILDLFPLVVSFLGLTMEQAKTTFFMLCIDIILIVILNVALTLWFVLRGKSEEYYKDYVKKYHMEDQHNPTSEGIPNEKDISKTNMVANESVNFEDDLNSSQNNEIGDSYKQLMKEGSKIKSTNSILVGKQSGRKQTQFQRSDDWPGRISSEYDPGSDVNFEPNLKSKRSGLSSSTQKIKFNQTILSQGKSLDDNLSYKEKSLPNNFTKEIQPLPKPKKENHRHIVQAQNQDDLPDIEDNTTHNGRESIFQKKQKLIRPKRVGSEKPPVQSSAKKASQRNLDQPLKLMKKDKKIGYFQSDAFESNADEQDLEQIIKQKVWQSTIRLEKPAKAAETNEETGYEEISPSWFNVQNQRMDISDYDESHSQE